MTDSLRLSPEELLAEHQWLRGLARSLVADPQLADDAVQETCVRALRAAPRDRTRTRSWLASILRNFIRQEARAAQTRRAHEGAHARSRPAEAAESTLELMERVSIQHQVVAAVLRLEEHYRAVVLLRFFEGLPQRLIARRLDMPIATVNSRLTRALQLIRADLDRRAAGGRSEWLAAIAPLTLPSTALGVVLMQSKLLAAAAVLTLGGLLYWFWEPAEAARELGEPVAAAGRDPLRVAARPLPESVDTAGRRAIPAPLTRDAEPTVPAQTLVLGSVVFADGRPAPDIAVGFAGTEAFTRSDADGSFALTLGDGDRTILAKDPRYLTVMRGVASAISQGPTVLVIAERISLSGQVVDGLGSAVAGAQVRALLPEDFETRLPQVLDRSRRSGWEVETAADGSFALETPAIPGMSLLATRQPLLPARRALAAHSDHRIYLVLGKDSPDGPSILGRVLDPQGRPVADAMVAAGLTSTLSDAQGNFRIVRKRAGRPTSIRAIKAGLGFARYTPDQGQDGAKLWPGFVELRLSGESRSISGRVLDAGGKPLAGALVWTPDAELFGLAGFVPVSVEYLSAGGAAPPQRPLPEALRDNPLEGEVTRGGMWRARQPSASWFYTETDVDGNFELTGLQQRAYRLRAMHAGTTQMVTSAKIPAGSAGVTLELRAEDRHALVAGVLRFPDGEPAANVSLSVFCNVRNTDTRIPGGRFVGELIRHGQRVRTDAAGRFRLERVPAQGVRLSIYGDTVIPRFFTIDDTAELSALQIEVRPRLHLEVRLADPERGNRIRGEGLHGERQIFSTIRSGSMKQVREVELHKGRSGVLVVPHTLRTIVLLKDGVEVGRAPVQLRVGQTRVLRL